MIVPPTRPSNPHHMQIWRFCKKVQKNLEIGTSNLEISKIYVELKKKTTTDYLFECFVFFFTFLAEVPKTYQSHFLMLFRSRVLENE